MLEDEETIAGEEPAPRLRSAPIERGSQIGRYVVIGELGQGAMGVVHAAYDPELDRKVAIKVLRFAELRDPDGSGGPSRLQREAQALAKLAHPNVVGIHDVGTMDERVWLAMEFVEGLTLGEWMNATPRTWREVVEVMTAAGRGLAAAHAADLLHRDFKPDNVMVGDDGRVRVMDFGLARPGDSTDSQPATDPEPGGTPALSIRLTRTGAMMGTPAYMSPEQLRGDADARSDQFAFCVTLWEALYGERPFPGDTLPELATAVSEGRRRTPPRHRRTPRWLHRICARGLDPDPAQRYGSMNTLLAAIERGCGRRRRLRVGLGLGLVLVAAGTTDGVRRYRANQRVAACEAAGDEIDATYDDDTRRRVRQGLLATGLGYAPETADKAIPWLDRFADAWREGRTRACINTTVDEVWDEALATRARWCFVEREIELATFVEELEHADRDIVRHAITHAADLGDPSLCVDTSVLARLPDAPPAAQYAGLVELRTEIARIGAAIASDRIDQALSRIEAALPGAAASPAMEAKLLAQRCAALHRNDRHETAVPACTEAYLAAAKAADWGLAAGSATSLIKLVGYNQARPEEGRLWARLDEVAIFLAGDPLGLRDARRLEALAAIEHAAGNYEAGVADLRQAIELRERALRVDDPVIGSSLANLAVLLHQSGAREEAIRTAERALEIEEAALGPHSPDVARSMHNLGLLERDTDPARARVLVERALRIREGALEPDHPQLADSHDALGSILKLAGELETADVHFRRALAIREERFGPDHPKVASSLNNIGNLQHARGQHEDAKATYLRGLEILDRNTDSDPFLAYGLAANLAGNAHDAGELDDAIEWQRRALQILDDGRDDDPREARVAAQLAGLCFEAKRYDDAVTAWAHAVRVDEAQAEPPSDAPRHRFRLGEMMVIAGRERAPALELAREALAAIDARGLDEPKLRAEIVAWIEAND